MIDIMLVSETYIDNPLVKSPEINAFAVQSLLQVPVAVLSRKDRTRIRQGWLQASKTCSYKSKKESTSEGGREDSRQTLSYELMALNLEVLALKVKIMQLPISHEVRMDNVGILLFTLTDPRA